MFSIPLAALLLNSKEIHSKITVVAKLDKSAGYYL
jgi:hypothetical protein